MKKHVSGHNQTFILVQIGQHVQLNEAIIILYHGNVAAILARLDQFYIDGELLFGFDASAYIELNLIANIILLHQSIISIILVCIRFIVARTTIIPTAIVVVVIATAIVVIVIIELLIVVDYLFGAVV